MRRPRPIEAIVVAVPARNEERRIIAAIDSVLAAAEAVDPHVTVAVSVAADGCTDRTVELLEDVADTTSRIRVLSGRWNSAGGARRAAVANGVESLASCGPIAAQATWIATTDADSQVPHDWLTRQLRYADSGHDAVAGIVELKHDDDRTDDLISRFARNYFVGEGTHTHVHGANMGIRASAYAAAGGFPAIQRSEDRLLWNELVRLNFRVVSPVALTVATSGRLSGRVVGGFADAMANAWT
jgi:glycosyltransferase involved in cell wall biosynthesis